MEDAFDPEKGAPAFSETDRKKAERLLQRLHPDYLMLEVPSEQKEDYFYSQLAFDFQRMAEKESPKDWLTEGKTIASDSELNLLTVDVLPESRIPFLGRFICIFKRLSRKMLFWYLKPVFERQSKVNQIMMNAISEQTRLLQEVQADLVKSMAECTGVDVDD